MWQYPRLRKHNTNTFSREVTNCYDLERADGRGDSGWLGRLRIVTARRIRVKREHALVPTNSSVYLPPPRYPLRQPRLLCQSPCPPVCTEPDAMLPMPKIRPQKAVTVATARFAVLAQRDRMTRCVTECIINELTLCFLFGAQLKRRLEICSGMAR